MFHNPLVCELESIAWSWKLSLGRTQHTSGSRPSAPDSARGSDSRLNAYFSLNPVFLSCPSRNQKPMCLREVSFKERYFLCAALVHSEFKGLTWELLWKQRRRSLAATAKTFKACLPHPGDCKHWLPATLSHSTELLCASSIYVHASRWKLESGVFLLCAQRTRLCGCRGRQPVLQECESSRYAYLAVLPMELSRCSGLSGAERMCRMLSLNQHPEELFYLPFVSNQHCCPYLSALSLDPVPSDRRTPNMKALITLSIASCFSFSKLLNHQHSSCGTFFWCCNLSEVAMAVW